ncbi:MAG: DNA polymerase III subunit chi [Betaproteobacteria bacterium]|nr:DNA polymerase III subunit chi [Betaproteobacteria bacterium]
MTQVSFYVYVADRLRLLHGLLSRKILPRGWRTYVAAADDAEAGRVDDYLWTARPGDFLPHARAEDEAASDSPVVIGAGEPDAAFAADALVWWQPSPPSSFGRFGNLIEIAENRAGETAAARVRCRYYQEHGYPINIHKMGEKKD